VEKLKKKVGEIWNGGERWSASLRPALPVSGGGQRRAVGGGFWVGRESLKYLAKIF
jgi:hypothetical protein